MANFKNYKHLPTEVGAIQWDGEQETYEAIVAMLSASRVIKYLQQPLTDNKMLVIKNYASDNKQVNVELKQYILINEAKEYIVIDEDDFIANYGDENMEISAEIDFSVTHNGLETIFSDESILNNTDAQYHWDFGDGNTSTEQNPIHIYDVEGSYKIYLTLTISNGTLIKSSKEIIITT